MLPRSARSSAGPRERLLLALAAAACAWLAAGEAAAVSCTVSTDPVNFGTYNPRDAGPNDASGNIHVHCTCSGGPDCADFGYSIEIQPGASGTTTARTMVRNTGTETLAYGLYRDSSHALPWGEGVDAQGRTYTSNLFGSFQTTPVYGRMPAAQDVRSGTYTDSPGVTIIY